MQTTSETLTFGWHLKVPTLSLSASCDVSPAMAELILMVHHEKSLWIYFFFKFNVDLLWATHDFNL